ncbi:IclR family transcriptional regulator [soil metagenome]
MSSLPSEPRSTAKSVTARALAVLGSFTLEEPEMSLSRLARASGLPVATVFRLARELEEGRFLDRNDAGQYSLGVHLWEMGLLSPVYGRMRENALPFLLRLHVATGQTVQLAVIDGFDAIYIEKLTSEISVPIQTRIGARIPLHATGVGKALLAFSPQSFTDVFLGLPLARFTEETTTNRRSLARELAQVAADGVARSTGEYVPGSTSIAAPVLVDGAVLAAIGLVNYRLESLEEYVPALLEVSSGLSSRLLELGASMGGGR